jgi:hypothetical protein
MYWHMRDLCDPANLVTSMVIELDNTPLYLMDVHWDSVEDRRGIAWKICTRVRWAWLDSLIVIVNCGHSWCQCDSHVSCCQVVTLQGFILI